MLTRPSPHGAVEMKRCRPYLRFRSHQPGDFVSHLSLILSRFPSSLLQSALLFGSFP